MLKRVRKGRKETRRKPRARLALQGLLRTLASQIPGPGFIFRSMRGPRAPGGCENPIFCSVLLMEPLAVFMPDLSSSEVCHAYSPKLYFFFEQEGRCPPGFVSFPSLGLGNSGQLLYRMNEYSQRCFLGMF